MERPKQETVRKRYMKGKKKVMIEEAREREREEGIEGTIARRRE